LKRLNKYFIFFAALYLLSLISACKNDSKKVENHEIYTDTGKVSVDIPDTEQLEGNPILLYITTEHAILRESPDINSAETDRRVKGDSLLFSNKISSFNSKIKLEGILYNEPWLRVITEGNKMSWIYGGCINFSASEHIKLREKVLDQSALTFFGPSLAQQISIYQKETKSIATLPGFRSLLTRGTTLQDSLEKKMNVLLQLHTGEELPDFFWLNELMDGMLVHYIGEQEKYYIFKDLKFWKSISRKTLETEDDDFMELMLSAYSADSIEYIYYGWQLPVDDSTTCSLLGSNIHTEVLNKMALAIDSNSYFKAEVDVLRQALVNDMSICKHYWLPLQAIEDELALIIERNYAFLDKYNWIAIKSHRQLLLENERNSIKVNLFEGES
jgi:hypothetical protein